MGGFLPGECQIVFADAGYQADGSGTEVDRQLAAANQHRPGSRRKISQERAEHDQGRLSGRQALGVVEDQDDRRVTECFGEETGHICVRKASGHGPCSNTGYPWYLPSQCLLQVGQELSGGLVGARGAQPGDRRVIVWAACSTAVVFPAPAVAYMYTTG